MHLINAIEGNMHGLKIAETLTITFGMLITFRNASWLLIPYTGKCVMQWSKEFTVNLAKKTKTKNL